MFADTDWQRLSETQIILVFVRQYREKHKIFPTPGCKSELSCFCFGEFRTLLYRQLMYTSEFTGCWAELQIPDIRAGVIGEINNCSGYSDKEAA